MIYQILQVTLNLYNSETQGQIAISMSLIKDTVKQNEGPEKFKRLYHNYYIIREI